MAEKEVAATKRKAQVIAQVIVDHKLVDEPALKQHILRTCQKLGVLSQIRQACSCHN
jgi:hypothetical protein